VTAAVTADDALHGRNTITSRAVRRVVSAVTAEQLGVTARDISVDLSDDRGSLTVTARTPIHVSPLGTGSTADGTILERLSRAQTTIRERCLTLTGSTIARVDLQVTGVQLRERRRLS
jgi:hypothetical protein